MSYEAAYLNSLSSIRLTYGKIRDRIDTEEQIANCEKLMEELSIKAFSLERYVNQSEGDKISTVLSSLSRIVEKLRVSKETINKELIITDFDKEILAMMGEAEVKAFEFQKESKSEFIDLIPK